MVPKYINIYKSEYIEAKPDKLVFRQLRKLPILVRDDNLVKYSFLIE